LRENLAQSRAAEAAGFSFGYFRASEAPRPAAFRKSATMSNPCQQCGACCAAFRVSFHWVEAPPTLPAELTERLGPQHLCMAGSNSAGPRCAALRGPVGGATACGIYAARPPACREVQAGDDKCRRARARHGLAALAPQR
jgi:uncharacterized protein